VGNELRWRAPDWLQLSAHSTSTAALRCTSRTLERHSGNLGAIGSGLAREFAFSGLPQASADATLTIRVRSDLNLPSEYLTLRLDGNVHPQPLFSSLANDCPSAPDAASISIPLAELANYLSDGTLVVRLEASPLVDSAQCASPYCEITLSYAAAFVDCDGDGLDDACECLIPGYDCDGNGIPDPCQLLDGSATDVNSNGRLDACEHDCDGNGLPDGYELLQGLAFDCNANQELDACDIASGIAFDIDSNGIPDTCQGDCNGNALPDTYEIALDPSKDCDLDLVLDSCEIAANRQLDCDQNAVLDSCEGGASGADCNSNGALDSCEIASGAQDKDADGVLDDCEFTRGDLNLDGVVGGADLGFLLSIWGINGSPIGDLDGDGQIAGADLTILLSNWGPY
jgi:hypothetical protein